MPRFILKLPDNVFKKKNNRILYIYRYRGINIIILIIMITIIIFSTLPDVFELLVNNWLNMKDN